MKNVIMLIFSQVLIKLLGFIYKLVITNIEGFGDLGNGYYNSGYQIYSLLLTLSSIGIPSVISKLISERLAIGDEAGAQRIFRVAMKFFATIGIVFSFGLYFGAGFIARHVLNVPDTAYVMRVLAPAVGFVSVSSVLRGYFAGQQDMKPTSVSQTLEQFLNCVLTITFVYACIGRETYIMAAAGNLSTTVAIIVTFFYLILYYRHNKIHPKKGQKSPEKRKTDRQLLWTILGISIPITLGSLVSVISNFVDTATVSNCIQRAFSNMGYTKEALEELAMSKAGILSKVETLVTFPLAINIAFSTALVPSISESIAKKQVRRAAYRISFSMFASIIIILPCAMGFIVLADPILRMIYPSASDGALVMQISALFMVFSALNQTISGAMYGLNLPRVPVFGLLIGVIVKTILNIVLISNPNINIVGAAIGSVACHVINFAICFKVLRIVIKFRFDLSKNVYRPLLATLIMGVCVFIAYRIFNLVVGNTISTLAAILVGVVTYIIAIFALKVMTEDDVLMLPYGTKINSLLVRVGVFKERRRIKG